MNTIKKKDALLKLEDNNYYFLASSSYADDTLRTLNYGDTFAVFDRWGDINPIGKGVQGVYHRGTRFINSMQLRLNDHRPMLLSSNIKFENEILSVDLANPPMDDLAGKSILQGTIHIQRTIFLQDGAIHEEIHLRNYGQETYHLRLHISCEADFKDIFEIRGLQRKQKGQLSPSRAVGSNKIRWSYKGLDDIQRSVELRLSPDPNELNDQSGTYHMTLHAKGSINVHCAANLYAEEEAPREETYMEAYGKIVPWLEKSKSIIAHVHTSNEQFNHWVNRSKNDLLSLLARTSGGVYPYAGVPWYNTIFGRDGIITAMSTLWAAPEISRGVLAFLAENQARHEDPVQDAEPGKILHEMRYGEMASTGEVPFQRYYGTIDATPLFIMLAGRYLQRTDDLPFIRAIWENITAALHWIDNYGDLDGDGFVEYQRKAASGLANQGWKDSHDSISHADGELATGAIALCEVQGYVYEAKCQAAYIAGRLGYDRQKEELLEAAQKLKQRFNDQFWDEKLGCYVLALDGDKAPCRVRSSNAGHCLFTGIATPEKALITAGTLMGKEMFTGWGIRTLAANEARYNPMSYHNGSVWPHDTAIVAAGFARYGMMHETMRLLQGLFEASLFIDLQRMPELFCGFDARQGEGPTSYPVACSPQAWSVAAVFLLLQSCLRLGIEAPEKELRFDGPELPSWVDDIDISNLPVDGQFVGVRICRSEGDMDIDISRKPADWKSLVM